MTVAVEHNRVVATGNGATTNWPFDFSAMDEADIEVYTYNIDTGVLTGPLSDSLYTVNGVPGANGSVDYPLAGDPLENTHKIIIQRIVPLLQPSTFSNSAGFDPATLTLRLDEMMRGIQQVNDAAARAYKVDISGTQDPDDIFEDLAAAVEAAETSAEAASTSAGAAATSAGAAAASAVAADASADAAAASAATINLPAVVANTMLVTNAAGTLRENKSFEDVRELLGTFDTRADASGAAIASAIASVSVGGIFYEPVTAASPALGPDLIENGTFASDTLWTKGTGWTIAGGLGVATASGNGQGLFQNETMVAGAFYLVTFTLGGFSAGGVRPFIAGGATVLGTTRSANGTYSEVLTAGATPTAIGLQAVGTTTLNIDNMVLKRLPSIAFQSADGRWWVPAATQMIVPALYGVIGDGVTDDTAALQACVTAAAGRQINIDGMTIKVPSGSISIINGLHIVGKGKVIYEGTDTLFLGAQIDVTNYNHVATAGQTVFTNTDPYKGGFFEVFVNGVLKHPDTYTLTHTTTDLVCTFATGATLGQNIQIRASRMHATSGVMAPFSRIVIGNGVQITTTQSNAGRAIGAGWRDDFYQPGRQFSNFVMEPGAIIMGETSADGFANPVWLNGSYNPQFLGYIYGKGANGVSSTVTDMIECDIGVLLTGEWTSSDFRFDNGHIGFVRRAIVSSWNTIEGILCTSYTFLNVGYAVWWEGRSNDVGHMLTMIGCHANVFYGVVYTNQVIDLLASDNDLFQNPSSPDFFFRFFELKGMSGGLIHDNLMWSYSTAGLQIVGVYLDDTARGIQVHHNQFNNVLGSTVPFIGMFCASGVFDCVMGPNIYQNGVAAIQTAAGTERIGVVTRGDKWIGPDPTFPKYNMGGNNWWMDDKWWIGINSGAALTLTTGVQTAINASLVSQRNPEALTTPLTIPAWATRVHVDITIEFAANATGVRQVRVRNGAAGIPELKVISPAAADGTTTVVKLRGEGTVTAGQVLNIDAYQNSGGNLDIPISGMDVYVRYT